MATGEYKLRVSVDGVNQAQGQLKNLGGTVNNIGKSVGRMVGAFVSIYAATKAIKYVIDNVKEEEAAVISLNAALSNTGIYSDNFSKALRDNASALQNMTIYADEAIIAGLRWLEHWQSKRRTTTARKRPYWFGRCVQYGLRQRFKWWERPLLVTPPRSPVMALSWMRHCLRREVQ